MRHLKNFRKNLTLYDLTRHNASESSGSKATLQTLSRKSISIVQASRDFPLNFVGFH